MNPDSIGIHALVWVGGWSEAEARRALGGARDCGYDRIEIPLLDSWAIDTEATRPLLEEHGLATTGNLFLTDQTDITSEDAEIVAAGERLLMGGADLVASLGGDYLCGTVYSKLGRPEKPVSPRGRENCVDVLRRVAEHAGSSGVRLGLELCNRYETPLLNTAVQALEILDEIDSPNACVHLDTFHMQIEESDLMTPVLACADRLGYVHVGESNRGPLGSGTVDFGSFFSALAHIGYAGPITFESFSSVVLAPELTSALCIWRDPWHDSEALASGARRFIDAQLDAVEAIAPVAP
jgi:D-psicose/D-tagatose/L-ribulose 3-epimerase